MRELPQGATVDHALGDDGIQSQFTVNWYYTVAKREGS